MADIATTDVTVTILPAYEGHVGAGSTGTRGSGQKDSWVSPHDGFRRVEVKIAFGNGVRTYPSTGVPLPVAADFAGSVRKPHGAAFGMTRGLKYLVIQDSDDAQGILWKYNRENHRLRGYIMGLDVTAAGAGTLDDFPIDTTDEPLAEAASIGAVGLEAGVNLLGRFMELKAAASTPAAQVIYATAVGW